MTARTFMSDDAIVATVDAMQASKGHRYPIALNYHDFSNLMWALQQLWNTTGCADDTTGAALADLAASMASGIASTLGIDMF